MIVIALVAVVVLVIFGVFARADLASWRRHRSREWRAYDDAHADDPPMRRTAAAARARRSS